MPEWTLKQSDAPKGSSFPLAKDTRIVVDTLTFPMEPAKHWWEWWPITVGVFVVVCIAIAAAKKPDPSAVHKTGPDRTPTTVVAP